MAGKFEIKKAKDGQFYFNLKASNGKVILTSERYGEKRKAKQGIESVRKNAANAEALRAEAEQRRAALLRPQGIQRRSHRQPARPTAMRPA